MDAPTHESAPVAPPDDRVRLVLHAIQMLCQGEQFENLSPTAQQSQTVQDVARTLAELRGLLADTLEATATPTTRQAWLVRATYDYVLFMRQPQSVDGGRGKMIWTDDYDGDDAVTVWHDRWEELTGLKLPANACVEVEFTHTARGFSVRMRGEPVLPTDTHTQENRNG